jgi:hypothetical protein
MAALRITGQDRMQICIRLVNPTGILKNNLNNKKCSLLFAVPKLHSYY